MTSIREIDLERDAPALVELMRATDPIAVVNAASYLHYERVSPPESRPGHWVAVEDDRVVGHATAFLETWIAEPGSGALGLAVTESHRRRGIGAALYERAHAHAVEIGASRLGALFHATPDGTAFGRARGFVEARSEQEAALDPRTVAETPVGDLRPLAAIDPRLAYIVDIEATHDMPATGEFKGMDYDEWAGFVLGHPLLSVDGSFVAFADGEAAALSLITVDHDTRRALSMFTGTRRDFRGRGLALQAKLASIRWAATNGVTRMLTYNDATNAPMLAINTRLGYVPVGRRVEMVKAETASSPAPRGPAT